MIPKGRVHTHNWRFNEVEPDFGGVATGFLDNYLQTQTRAPSDRSRTRVPPEDEDIFGEDFPWSHRLELAARQTFGVTEFRGFQLAIMNALLKRKSVFALMPTGFGKSLCFQLPAVVGGGVTFVISPLLALIHDQVNNLRAKGINVVSLTSDQTREDHQKVLAQFEDLDGHLPCFVYTTPESMVKCLTHETQVTVLIKRLKFAKKLNLLVIDEAHCISEWGANFRPSYRKLGNLRVLMGRVPILCCTASATEAVIEDCCRSLKLEEPVLIRESLNLPNLLLEVVPKSPQTIFDILTRTTSGICGIIYCLSQKDCETMAIKLNVGFMQSKALARAAPYHAGLSKETRLQTQKEWMSGVVSVVVATVAFGMGIDNPRTRLVIHYCLPPSLSRYYQEIGRAGRDGKAAHAILYYAGFDALKLANMQEVHKPEFMQELQLMQDYCEDDTRCRRVRLLNYFRQAAEGKSCQGSCDVCFRSLYGPGEQWSKPADVTFPAECIEDLLKSEHSLNKTGLIDVLLGRLTDLSQTVYEDPVWNRYFGCLRVWNDEEIQQLINYLLGNNYLRTHLMGKGPKKYLSVRAHKPINRRMVVEYNGVNTQPRKTNHPPPKFFHFNIGRPARQLMRHTQHTMYRRGRR